MSLEVSRVVTTPHRYKAGHRLIKPVDLLVMHYTAVPFWSKTDHGSNPRRIVNWLSGAGRKSSTHYVVLRNGDVIQGAPLSDRTWHAGGSKFVTPDGETLSNINGRSIGLDFDNVGMLYEIKPDVFVDAYGYSSYRKTKRVPRSTYRGPTPVEVDGQYWEPYPEVAVDSMREVLTFLVDEFPALRGSPWRLVGHQDVRSTKSDPGGACPMDELREPLR
jgi:N-acetyl-anhydromuramyl-L-alanine amidase AmpD